MSAALVRIGAQAGYHPLDEAVGKIHPDGKNRNAENP